MPESLAAKFRAAVSSGEFQRAEEIWTAYTAERLAEVRNGDGEKLAETQELMEWTRQVVLCARSQSLHTLKERMMELYAAGAYARAGR
jgi:hypothetical protein